MTFVTLALSAAPARLLTRRFWRDYLVTMRPYLMFVSGFTGLAGLALAPGVPLVVGAILGAACFLAYGFGQALTDTTQTDTDALSAPYRPLVRGTVRPQDVRAVSLAGLGLCGLALTVVQPLNLPLAALCVLGLATYTTFKRRWWAGPFYNAWIVAVLALIGYLAGVGAAGVAPAWSPLLMVTVGAVFFGYANFVLAGYFKDVEADRATGYRTVPVVFGRVTAAWVSDLFAVIALAAAAWGILMRGGPVSAVALVAGGALWLGAAIVTAVAQVRLHRVRRDADAHRAVAPVVHAYLLMLAALMSVSQSAWLPLLLALYVAFVRSMRRRPAEAQI